MKKRKSVLYHRFSTGRQIKGQSISRQTESPQVQQFVKAQNLQIVDSFGDEGVSAFKTKNNFSENAELGKFIAKIRRGDIERGTVLIVEDIDRFTRAKASECLTKLIEILKAGVCLGVANMNVIIDLDAYDNNMMVRGWLNDKFNTAREESLRKAVYSRDNLRAKLQRAQAGERVYFGAMCPSYLTGAKDGKWQTNEQKVLLVKRIFNLYLEGNTYGYIARLFNAEKVPGLSNGTVNRWQEGNIKAILVNKNVIGYCKIDLSDREGKIIESFESDSYYPQIVSATVFQKAQNRIALNRNSHGGSKTGNIPNLFKRIIFCASCGDAIDVVQCQDKTERYSYAYCRGAYMHRGCKCRTRIPTKFLEFGILSHLTQLEKEPEPYHPQFEAMQNDIAKIDLTIKRFSELLADPDLTDVSQLKSQLKQAVAGKEVLVKQLEAERAKVVKLNEYPKAIGSFMEAIWEKTKANEFGKQLTAYLKDTANRKKLRTRIPDIYERITVQHTTEKGKQVTEINCTLVSGMKYTVWLTKVGYKTYGFEAEYRRKA